VNSKHIVNLRILEFLEKGFEIKTKITRKNSTQRHNSSKLQTRYVDWLDWEIC